MNAERELRYARMDMDAAIRGGRGIADITHEGNQDAEDRYRAAFRRYRAAWGAIPGRPVLMNK